MLIVKAQKWDGVTNFVVTADENGKAKVVSAKNLASLATDANLWKIEQALDKDGDYTFIFTNKAGKKMTVDGKNFFHSVANAPYNNGVVFEMDGEDPDYSQNPRYFGLYKSGLYTLTAKDLYFFEKTGFTITIDGKLAGDPFTGNRLAPMTWNGTEFVKAADNKTAVSLRFKTQTKNMNIS